MQLKAILLTIAVLALGAAPAHAASARIVITHYEGPHNSDQQAASLEYVAAPGESNRLTITGNARDVVLSDDGAPLSAGDDCAAIDPHSVRCTLASLGPYASLYEVAVTLGDGDDHLAPARPAHADADVDVRVDGGTGNDVLEGGGELSGGDGVDRLVGGSGSDSLDGGPGDDAIDGGPGRDTVTYGDRTKSVTIDLAARRGGEAGEHDSYASVEDATGGTGADVIRGDAGRNTLDGGPSPAGHGGGDEIEGNAGNDDLNGTHDADVLDGGPGRDHLDGWDGADRYDGGAGDDVLEFDGGGAGPVKRTACGPGLDAVVAPVRSAIVARDCETVQTGWYDVAVAPLYAKVPSLHVRLPRDHSENRPACSGSAKLKKGSREVVRTGTFKLREGKSAEVRFTPRTTALRGTVVVALAASDYCPGDAPTSVGAFTIRR